MAQGGEVKTRQKSHFTSVPISVLAVGAGGIQELQENVEDDMVCWAILRFQVGSGAFRRTKFIAMNFHGAAVPFMKRGMLIQRAKEVLPSLGDVHASLDVETKEEITVDSLCERLLPLFVTDSGVTGATSDARSLKQQYEDMLSRKIIKRSRTSIKSSAAGTVKEKQQKVPTDLAIKAIANPKGPYNWLLLEPTALELHNAGYGGLLEMKTWLEEDKVLFGAVRFTFGWIEGSKIVKHIFVHWVGPRTPAVRRGKLNSKATDAFRTVRAQCVVALKKECHGLDDLDLEELIKELRRLTIIDGSHEASDESQHISVEEYLATLEREKEKLMQEEDDGMCEDIEETAPPLPTVKTAVETVRSESGNWNWALIGLAQEAVPSRGQSKEATPDKETAGEKKSLSLAEQLKVRSESTSRSPSPTPLKTDRVAQSARLGGAGFAAPEAHSKSPQPKKNKKKLAPSATVPVLPCAADLSESEDEDAEASPGSVETDGVYDFKEGDQVIDTESRRRSIVVKRTKADVLLKMDDGSEVWRPASSLEKARELLEEAKKEAKLIQEKIDAAEEKLAIETKKEVRRSCNVALEAAKAQAEFEEKRKEEARQAELARQEEQRLEERVAADAAASERADDLRKAKEAAAVERQLQEDRVAKKEEAQRDAAQEVKSQQLDFLQQARLAAAAAKRAEAGEAVDWPGEERQVQEQRRRDEESQATKEREVQAKQIEHGEVAHLQRRSESVEPATSAERENEHRVQAGTACHVAQAVGEKKLVVPRSSPNEGPECSKEMPNEGGQVVQDDKDDGRKLSEDGRAHQKLGHSYEIDDSGGSSVCGIGDVASPSAISSTRNSEARIRASVAASDAAELRRSMQSAASEAAQRVSRHSINQQEEILKIAAENIRRSRNESENSRQSRQRAKSRLRTESCVSTRSVRFDESDVLVWVVEVDRAGGEELGIDLDYTTLEINMLRDNGLIADWNLSRPESAVRPGDRILEVNGKKGTLVLSECVQRQVLQITIERGHIPTSMELGPSHFELRVDTPVNKMGWASTGLPPERVFVTQVVPNSWGANNGLRIGDEVLAANGRLVSDMFHQEFLDAVKRRPLTLVFSRKPEVGNMTSDQASRTQSSPAISAERGSDCQGPFAVVVEHGVGSLGWLSAGLPPQRIFVSEIDPGSWAVRNGLRIMDELVEIDGQQVSQFSPQAFLQAVKRRPLRLTFERHHKPRAASEKVVGTQAEIIRRPVVVADTPAEKAAAQAFAGQPRYSHIVRDMPEWTDWVGEMRMRTGWSWRRRLFQLHNGWLMWWSSRDDFEKRPPVEPMCQVPLVDGGSQWRVQRMQGSRFDLQFHRGPRDRRPKQVERYVFQADDDKQSKEITKELSRHVKYIVDYLVLWPMPYEGRQCDIRCYGIDYPSGY